MPVHIETKFFHIKHGVQIPTPFRHKIQTLYVMFKICHGQGGHSPGLQHTGVPGKRGGHKGRENPPPPQRILHAFLSPIQCDAQTILTHHWPPRLGSFEGCSPSWYLSGRFLLPHSYPRSKWPLLKFGLNCIVLSRYFNSQAITFINEQEGD